ncbi:hypothetical protein Tco_0639017 [Tanacetum coccineum]
MISGKVPQISHLKPFGCQVTILNTSNYLGKFEGKADEVYLLPNKRVEETLNLRFLEDKPNVQGIGHEWYFDLFPAGRLVSAGCTMVLLVVIFPAGRLVSAGCTMVLLVVIFPAGRLVSAGCTMVLLIVIFSADWFLLVVLWFCWKLLFLLDSLFLLVAMGYAAGRFIYANRVFVPATLSADVLSQAAASASAGPSGVADKGKAPMPDLDIPAEFVAEDAQARKRFEEEQASERLVQRLRAEDLAQEYMPNVSEERAKELDELMMRMTETDWLNLMMQVGSNPALARELLGADVTEENFVERMTAIKDKKKRALADLRYRALKGKPMQQSEVNQMMRNLVKNQWCAAHNGTITMKAVKAMSKQQLIEEYEYICRRLEKDRLLSAQYNLFRPKPVISEPPSKRQRVDRDTSQPSGVPAASTHHADDPDSAGGGSFNPAGSATPMTGSAVPDTAGGTLGTTVTASTVPTSAAMDSAGSHHELGISPFADSADSSSPSPVSTDHIPIDVLFEPTSGGINEFFLDSDEDEQIGMSRVAADPDSDDEVLAEILFRGQYISGAGVVIVDKLPDDEIVDPRVKVETISESASSPPRSRRKHRGVRSDDSLWDKPVEDFFSSESESDDDMANYIPPLPYGAFKDWEMVICPLSNSYYHVYYQENRRQKSFTYLKELLPHVYREDLLPYVTSTDE